VIAASLPFVFALLWASSYAGAKIAIHDMTPFAVVGVRLAIAAIAAAGLMTVLRQNWPRSGLWLHLMIGGALVHGLALSMTHVAMVQVDATPTALVHAFHPILTAALGVLLLGEKFAWWQWLGVAVGFAGVVVGVPHNVGTGNLLLLGLSLFGLTAGTLYLKRFCPDVRPFPATAVQLIGGALFALLAMALFETPHVHVTVPLIAAMAWNILAMSIGGIVIYNLMLERYGAGKASSGFFVVPGASALIAWLVLGEHISPLAIAGLTAATLGVVLVWWRRPAAR
jgi:drug/metabolite transporter (DMT)-like permease